MNATDWETRGLASYDRQIEEYAEQHQRMLGIDPSVFTQANRTNWYWALVGSRDDLATGAMKIQACKEAGWDTTRSEQALAAAITVLDNWVRDAEAIFGFTVREGQSRPVSKVVSPEQYAERRQAEAAAAKRRAEEPQRNADACMTIGIVGFLVSVVVGIVAAGHQTGGTGGWAVLGGFGVGLAFFLFMSLGAWFEGTVVRDHPELRGAANVAAAGLLAYDAVQHHEQKQADRLGRSVAEHMKQQ